MFFKKDKPAPTKPILPVEQILQDLAQLSKDDWCQYAFSRDPITRKIPDDAKRSYMEQAASCGVSYAHRVKELYGTDNPEQIAAKMGIDVSYPALPKSKFRILFAEFRAPNTIHVYTDTLEKCAPLLDNAEVAKILTPDINIRKVLLAHELFHVIEEIHRKEIYTRTERIRLWKIGPLHNDSPILALGEIAAMAFAQELLQLPFSPYILDVFLVYGYYPEEATALYEEMMTLSKGQTMDLAQKS